MKSFESIARAAYEAFSQSLYGPLATYGCGLMTWNQLPGETRDAWMAAARKMAEEINQVH